MRKEDRFSYTYISGEDCKEDACNSGGELRDGTVYRWYCGRTAGFVRRGRD